MRAVVVTSLLLLCGCGKSPAPPSQPEPLQSATEVPARRTETPAEPEAKKPSVKLSLDDARKQIVGGQTRSEVKALMGAPTETRESQWGPNRLHSDEWVYRNQQVVWDGAADKYHPVVRVIFLKGRDDAAVEVRTR